MRHMLMLNIPETAEVIGMSEELTVNAIRTGNVSYIRIDGEMLVPHDDLMRWLDDQLYKDW